MSEDTRIAGVATLLYGLAMENILKAVLLKEGIAQIGSDGQICWNTSGAKSHDLVSICRSGNLFTLDARQEKLMERMSAFVCWAGKYPTPLTLEDQKSKSFKGLLLEGQPEAQPPATLPVEFRPEDKKSFEDLYRVFWKRVIGDSLGTDD